jgi:hypothetical protein
MATHGALTALREHNLAHPNPKDQGLSSEDDPGAKVRPSLIWMLVQKRGGRS